MTNSIMIIHPYQYQGEWVFDDDKVGLIQEPFVSGADDIIDKMVVDLADPEDGFTLVFSAIPFPSHQFELEWRSEDSGGNWYYSTIFNMEGWLCPAMFEYFDVAPTNIYIQIKQKVC